MYIISYIWEHAEAIQIIVQVLFHVPGKAKILDCVSSGFSICTAEPEKLATLVLTTRLAGLFFVFIAPLLRGVQMMAQAWHQAQLLCVQ